MPRNEHTFWSSGTEKPEQKSQLEMSCPFLKEVFWDLLLWSFLFQDNHMGNESYHYRESDCSYRPAERALWFNIC